MNVTSDKPIGALLRQVDRLLDQQMNAALAEHGLDRHQWQVLNTLAAGALPRHELDHRLREFAAANLGERIRALRDRGWLAEADGRLSLTDDGRHAHATVRRGIAAFRDQTRRGVSDQAYLTTLATLERMARNLGGAP